MAREPKRDVENDWTNIREESDGNLKEKLERLIDRSLKRSAERAGAKGEARREWVEPDEPDPDAPPFLADQFERGKAAECGFPIDSYHGRVRIGAGLEMRGDILALIGADEAFAAVRPERILYLDLETTGLSPGSSTYAFMTGLGYFDEGEFRIRQHFMRDFSDEIDILEGIEMFLDRFEAVVTFNGRAYDVPLLEGRYILARLRTRLTRLPHLDVLYPCRQIWRRRLESCSLRSLEENVLRVERHGDVPGAEIPQLYFDYLRTRNPYWISKVFHHNRLDILSMMCMLALCHDLVGGRSQAAIADGREILGLAMFYERRNKYEESSEYFAAALETESLDSANRAHAIRRASQMHRRAGNRGEAAALWRAGAQEGGHAAIEFLRNLAIQLGHHERRHADALAVVEEALGQIGMLEGRYAEDPKLVRWREDFERRREKLRKKLGIAE